MKRNLIYLLPLLLAGLTACSKKTEVQNIPLATPTGTYGGYFQLVHTTVATGKNDTLTTNLTMVLSSNGTFTITGDTSTLHAGSFGTYSLGYSDDLSFTDKTLAPGTPKKVHLNGDYRFLIQGAGLGLDRNVGDSLSYQYYFTRASN